MKSEIPARLRMDEVQAGGRMSKSESMTNSECRNQKISSFVIRHSSFVQRSSTDRNTQRGNVLLLTLLLLSFFLFIGLVWGTLVLRGVQSVAKTDEAIVAFAAAESGLEEALFQTRKSTPPLRFWIRLEPMTLSNGATWQQRSTDYVTPFVIDALATNEIARVNLYDPAYNGLPPPPLDQVKVKKLESIRIRWDSVGGTLNTLRVHLTEWDGTALQPVVSVTDRPLTGGCQFINEPVNNKAYQLVLIAQGPVANVRIEQRMYDEVCDLTNPDAINPNIPITSIAIPSDLVIRSRGTYGSAQQAVEMSFPRVAPW